MPLIQRQKFYDFLKAEKKTFQMMYFNPKFHWGLNLSFFGLGPWAIIHGLAELGNVQIQSLMTPFERSLSKLSENQKIIEIEFTEFKLWQPKECPNH